MHSRKAFGRATEQTTVLGRLARTSLSGTCQLHRSSSTYLIFLYGSSPTYFTLHFLQETFLRGRSCIVGSPHHLRPSQTVQWLECFTYSSVLYVFYRSSPTSDHSVKGLSRVFSLLSRRSSRKRLPLRKARSCVCILGVGESVHFSLLILLG